MVNHEENMLFMCARVPWFHIPGGVKPARTSMKVRRLRQFGRSSMYRGCYYLALRTCAGGGGGGGSSPPKLVMYVICPVFTGEYDLDRDFDADFDTDLGYSCSGPLEA